MYKYKIGYSWEEGSGDIELEHEKLFTKDEITDMVGQAVVEVIKKYKMNDRLVHAFEDTFHDISEYMESLFGFKKIEYDVYWCINGMTSIFKRDDWTDYFDEERSKILDGVIKKVNEAGFSERDDFLYRDKEG